MEKRYVKCIFASEKFAIFDCVLNVCDFGDVELNIIVKNNELLEYRVETRKNVDGEGYIPSVKIKSQKQIDSAVKYCKDFAKWVFSE